MPKFEVISDFIDKETGERISAGSVFEASGKRIEALRKAGVVGDEVKEGEETLTLETFADLKADEQKALLKQLGIEGDDSNEEKRVMLYAAFLNNKNDTPNGGDSDGVEADNSPGDGAGNADGGKGVSAD